MKFYFYCWILVHTNKTFLIMALQNYMRYKPINFHEINTLFHLRFKAISSIVPCNSNQNHTFTVI